MRDATPHEDVHAHDVDLQVRATWLYHVEGLTQSEIARSLRISRARTARLLMAARASGLVHVSVDPAASARVALSRALASRFGLRAAIVVPGEAGERIAQSVGAAAGEYVAGRLRPGLTLAVGWGETLNGALPALSDTHAARLSVVSLLGGMTHSRAVNPAAVARRLADALHAECYQLAAPLLVTHEATRDALWREPALEALRARARNAGVALVSVGDVSEDATLAREGLLSARELAGLRARGAVGDVLCQFLDAKGGLVDHPVNRRAVTVGLDSLRAVRELVLASGGVRKIAALKAALAALPVTTLVTDQAAAEGLLSG